MKTKKLLILIAAAIAMPLAATACGMGEQAPEGYENTSVHHAYQHWSQGKNTSIPFVMLDVRTPEEYAQGRIPGAHLIPVQELEARLAEVPRDRQVYVYCRSGRRSVTASRMLAKAGFTRIENMTGGIEAWEAAGYPIKK